MALQTALQHGCGDINTVVEMELNSNEFLHLKCHDPQSIAYKYNEPSDNELKVQESVTGEPQETLSTSNT